MTREREREKTSRDNNIINYQGTSGHLQFKIIQLKCCQISKTSKCKLKIKSKKYSSHMYNKYVRFCEKQFKSCHKLLIKIQIYDDKLTTH